MSMMYQIGTHATINDSHTTKIFFSIFYSYLSKKVLASLPAIGIVITKSDTSGRDSKSTINPFLNLRHTFPKTATGAVNIPKSFASSVTYATNE